MRLLRVLRIAALGEWVRLQLRMQQTGEGLSVVAVSYIVWRIRHAQRDH